MFNVQTVLRVTPHSQPQVIRCRGPVPARMAARRVVLVRRVRQYNNVRMAKRMLAGHVLLVVMADALVEAVIQLIQAED